MRGSLMESEQRHRMRPGALRTSERGNGFWRVSASRPCARSSVKPIRRSRPCLSSHPSVPGWASLPSTRVVPATTGHGSSSASLAMATRLQVATCLRSDQGDSDEQKQLPTHSKRPLGARRSSKTAR